MTSEADVCTIIKNSFLLQGHYLYKIPDPTGNYSSTIKRDFDMFGRYFDKPIYIEVKYLSGLKSFNLKLIEDHQMEALLEYTKIPSALSIIALGVNVSRKMKVIYFWDAKYIEQRRKEEHNISKRELEALPFYTVKTNKELKKKLIQESVILDSKLEEV